MTPAGLPHSEISGSKAVCASPKLFAAYHVLHRFPEPRHPPCALACLTSISGSPQKNRKDTEKKSQATTLLAEECLLPAYVACQRSVIQPPSTQTQRLDSTKGLKNPSPANCATTVPQKTRAARWTKVLTKPTHLPSPASSTSLVAIPGAGAPRNRPSVLKSSSNSGQWIP